MHAEVVARLQAGESAALIAHDLGVTAWVVRSWGRKAGLTLSKSAGLKAAWSEGRFVRKDLRLAKGSDV